MALFIDLQFVPEHITNDALDGIYKAMSGHDHGDDGIWKPHHSPLVRRLIELFTKRGLDRLEAVKTQLLAWEQGKHYKPSEVPVPAPGTMLRWTPDELSLVELYLEALPPAQWSLDDHMMAIEFVMQSYLPADALVAEADWLTAKASLLGKVQANIDKNLNAKQADKVLAALPSSLAGAVSVYGAAVPATLQFARARAVENVRALSESARHRMRTIVADDLEQRALGNVPPGTSSLESKLLDAFGTLNRDWRRIAVTEAGEAQLQGLIASLKPGTRVRRIEQYDGACAFCRKIDGRVMTVISASEPNKDPETMVWPGKNNLGRSASPKKRVGDLLVHREPDEMWQVPAGLVHPHCRGRWDVVYEGEPGDDPDFAATMNEILYGKS